MPSRLASEGVGALVISADGKHIDGITSERDIFRCLQPAGIVSIQDVIKLCLDELQLEAEAMRACVGS